MYALVGLCALWAAYCFVRLVGGGDNRHWLGYILAAVLGLYSHYTMGLFILVLNMCALMLWLVRWPHWPAFPFLTWLLAQSIVVLLYFPWLANLPAHWQRVQNQTTYPLWILTTPQALALFAVAGFIIFSGLVSWLRGQRSNPIKPGVILWGTVLTLLLLIYVGLIVVILINRAMSLTRQFYLFVPFLYLALALFLTLLPNWRRWTAALLAATLILAIVSSLTLQKPGWRAATSWIAAEAEAEDVVILSPHWLQTPMVYYVQNYAQTEVPLVGLSLGQVETKMPPLMAEYQRAWLVLNQKEERWTDPQQQVRSWFYGHYLLESEAQFGLLDVARFRWGEAVSHRP